VAVPYFLGDQVGASSAPLSGCFLFIDHSVMLY
jgi:hypothetical protein